MTNQITHVYVEASWSENPEICEKLSAAFKKHRNQPWVRIAVADYCNAIPDLGLPPYDEENPGWSKLAAFLKESTKKGQSDQEKITDIQQKLTSTHVQKLIAIIKFNQTAKETGEVVILGHVSRKKLEQWAEECDVQLSAQIKTTDITNILNHERRKGFIITRTRLKELLQQESFSARGGRSGRSPGQQLKKGMTMS